MPVRHLGSAFGLVIVALVALVALAATGGCVFTNPINVPPTIQSINHPDKIGRGDQATFTAQVTDDQTQPPIVEWATTPGTCPSVPSDPHLWPANRSRVPVFTVESPTTKDPFCVWVVAIDQYGASKAANYYAVPVNHAPNAKLEVISPTQGPPYPFLSRFHLSVASSTDVETDPLTFTWTLAPNQPPGSQARLLPCPGSAGNAERCLDSDIKGDYRIDVAVSDQTDSSPAGVTLTVLEDKLPCIDLTTPDFANGPNVHTLPSADDPQALSSTDDFSVLRVVDDLDPLPSAGDSQLHFLWSKAVNNEPFVPQPQALDVPKLAIHKSLFRIGDKVRVRVEIRDRNNDAEIQNVLLGCQDADTCAVTTPNRAFGGRAGCLLRVGWTVEYR